MTTSESNGRFFTKRIDSNRELECSTDKLPFDSSIRIEPRPAERTECIDHSNASTTSACPQIPPNQFTGDIQDTFFKIREDFYATSHTHTRLTALFPGLPR